MNNNCHRTDKEFSDYMKMGIHLNQFMGSSSSIGAKRVRNVCVAFRAASEQNNRAGFVYSFFSSILVLSHFHLSLPSLSLSRFIYSLYTHFMIIYYWSWNIIYSCLRALALLEHEYCYLKNKLHEFLQVKNSRHAQTLIYLFIFFNN